MKVKHTVSLDAGSFCFCGNSLPAGKVAASKCNSTCPVSEGGDGCGGRYTVSIHYAKQEMKDLQVFFSP